MTRRPGEYELSPEETSLAYGPMKVLRPHLASSLEFMERVNNHQRPEGYRLVASFDTDRRGGSGVAAVSVAGFRPLHTLAWGDLLYIDDLVTLESHRGLGHARRLLDWVLTEARRLGCAQVHLDSAPHRHAAHRLYLNEGYHIAAYHFSREV